MRNHIILIGFKNVGKSTIGSALANALQRPFIDLDTKIREKYAQQKQKEIPCTVIMQCEGEHYFRTLEHTVLQDVLKSKKPCIIATGGGTPMSDDNRTLLAQQKIIHIRAPKNIVFDRIMANGKPAFFPAGEDAYQTFQQLWEQRIPVFEEIADLQVENTKTVGEVVEEILKLFFPPLSKSHQAT